MNTLQNYIRGLFILLFFLTSCVSKKSIQQFSFSRGEIIILLGYLDLNVKDKNHLHILFAQQYNDSTTQIMIAQNSILPGNEIEVCKYYEIEGRKVFLYDKSCDMKLPEYLRSKDNTHPAWVMHSKQQIILVERKEGKLFFYNLNPMFSSKSESIDYDTIVDF